MGCDIHIFIEYKRDNKWHEDRCTSTITKKRGFGRNYLFFGALAAVRSHGIKPIYPRRGVPADVTEGVQKIVDEWGKDAHSHTYLSMDEYKIVIDHYNSCVKGDKDYMSIYSVLSSKIDFYDIYTHCKDLMDKSQADALLLNEPSLAISECRLIMFFDS
jgi:hypothetical protein